MKTIPFAKTPALALLLAAFALLPARAAAPRATMDPSANITDVYTFVQTSGAQKFLVAALAVYPHEEPGVAANNYSFDDTVLYALHVATGSDLAAGRATWSYEFRFTTRYKNKSTLLQSYTAVVNNVDDAGQNLTQTYTVTKVDHRQSCRTPLGSGVVPPNNQGISTPFYNQGDNGNNPAKDGAATGSALDRYTSQSVRSLQRGYIAFAGQRDDAFYADQQSVFDLLQLRSPGKDSQGGFNDHLIALQIPAAELGGDQQIVGIYATTSRQATRNLGDTDERSFGRWVQVARRGNPLFNEWFIATEDKDLYNRTSPTQDSILFRKYAEKPEMAKLINVIVFGGSGPAIESNRTDVAGVFIPDLIKVDLSTAGARLAGNGPGHPINSDAPGFSRLSIFGGDTLTSAIQPGFGNGTIPGGWPNGRRFGDDVVDILASWLLSDLRGPLIIRVADGIDGVSRNDQGFNKVFPYAGTPHTGRNHAHP